MQPSSTLLGEKKTLVATCLGLAWGVIICLIYSLGVFGDFEELIIDRLELFPASGKPSSDLALVDIQHIPSDRPWPWSRLDYASILRALKPQHPQSVVFEMLLHDKDARYSAFDNLFAEQVAQQNKVLFSAAALRPDDAAPPPAGIVPLTTQGDFRPLAAFGSFFWPVATFSALGNVGISNLSTEKNQNLRKVQLVFLYRQQVIPSLALWAAALRLKAEMSKTSVNLGHDIILRDPDGRALRHIPIDARGFFHLRFRQPVLPIARIDPGDLVLANDQSERGAPLQVDLSPLVLRQIWVGATDHSVVSLVETVNGPVPPVSIQMQTTRQIIDQDYLHPLPLLACWLMFLGFGVFLSRNFIQLGGLGGTFILLVCALLITIFSIAAFQLANVTFPLGTLAVLFIGIIVCGFAARYWEDLHSAPLDPQMPLDFG